MQAKHLCASEAPSYELTVLTASVTLIARRSVQHFTSSHVLRGACSLRSYSDTNKAFVLLSCQLVFPALWPIQDSALNYSHLWLLAVKTHPI